MLKAYARAAVAVLCLLAPSAVHAETLRFGWVDPAGDHVRSAPDVRSLTLTFDNTTGDYTVVLTADPARPFTGVFRVNVNLYNPDAGLTITPATLSDTFNDFNFVTPAETVTFSGSSANLLSWHAGDRVGAASRTVGLPVDALYTQFASGVTTPPFLTANFGIDTVGDDAIAIIQPLVQVVAIDVKPGSSENPVNVRSRGLTPVALLTTSAFVASAIDPSSLRFGASGSEAAAVHVAVEDVDGDGDADLLAHFRTEETLLACSSTEAVLTGTTYGGELVRGADTIRPAGCR